MKRLLLITLIFFGILNCSQMSQLEENVSQANNRMSQEHADALEKIIDKNKVNELKKLLQDKSFDINATGPSFGIRYNIREFGYGPAGRERGSWKERYSVLVPHNGLTPLMFASIYAKPAIIHELLHAGANPNQGYKIEGTIYYPLTVGYTGNFSDRDEGEALVAMTQEFLKTNISREHFEQALNFVDTMVEAYSPELASRLRELFQTSDYAQAQRAKRMKLPQKSFEAHLKKTGQEESAGSVAMDVVAPEVSKYL